jgi:hypothetical protein
VVSILRTMENASVQASIGSMVERAPTGMGPHAARSGARAASLRTSRSTPRSPRIALPLLANSCGNARVPPGTLGSLRVLAGTTPTASGAPVVHGHPGTARVRPSPSSAPGTVTGSTPDAPRVREDDPITEFFPATPFSEGMLDPAVPLTSSRVSFASVPEKRTADGPRATEVPFSLSG